MKKRGQAAMEFLMTYGWAILAAAVVIAALAAFGIFQPGRYVAPTCTVTAPFSCDEYRASATTGITMVVRNGGGEDYTVNSVAVTNCGTNSNPVTITDGNTTTVSVTCSPVLTQGRKFKGDITITYIKFGGTLSMESAGKIVVSVAA